MNILLLTHGFNSLTQRLHVELRERGHGVTVEFDIADSVTEEAVALARPDVLVAPFLKRRIPASVWRRLPCLVVHPGIPGDGGPSALDWAILNREADWGVTVLQATDELDAGPVWAWAGFPMRDATKGDLYRGEVTDAAVAAVLAALERLAAARAAAPDRPPVPPPLPEPPRRGRWQPLVRRADRAIAWDRDDAATVLRKVRSADGHPGVADALFGRPCRLFDAHPVAAAARAGAGPADAPPGTVLARRGPAVMVATCDGGGVWIGQVRREEPPAAVAAERPALKLPATLAFADEAATLPGRPVPLWREAADPVDCPVAAEVDEIDYREWGEPGARIGWLGFDFHNGAMGVRACRRLLDAIAFARGRDTQALVLAGGAGFFSNGIHLHEIEHAAQRDDGGSAAQASWDAIQAIDDVCLALIETTDRLTVAALRGNAGAGGCFLALACDEVWAAPGVVLNPHYKNMGNLYGSEYWTYLLPRRLAARLGTTPADARVAEAVRRITQGRLPVGTAEAVRLGLVDAVLNDLGTNPQVPSGRLTQVNGCIVRRVTALVADHNRLRRVQARQQQRRHDEAERPLAAYREQELARMHRNFFGFDPSYHVARHHFVTRKPQAFTPRHLATHRDPAARGGR